jgi:hypothetical protein
MSKLNFNDCVRILDEHICPRLDEIANLFRDPEVQVSLIIRTPSAPNGEILVTNDDLDQLRAVIDRREAAGVTRHRGDAAL